MLCNEIQKLSPSILFPDKKVGLRVERGLASRIWHSCRRRQERKHGELFYLECGRPSGADRKIIRHVTASVANHFPVHLNNIDGTKSLRHSCETVKLAAAH